MHPQTTISLETRLWRRTVVRGADDCWEWQGSRSKGYGQLKVNGRSIQAHRLVWELVHGPIPDGLCVLHRCDNPPCLNPAHLWLGTTADNNADMMAKRRHGHGDRPSASPYRWKDARRSIEGRYRRRWR